MKWQFLQFFSSLDLSVFKKKLWKKIFPQVMNPQKDSQTKKSPKTPEIRRRLASLEFLKTAYARNPQSGIQ